MHHASNYSIVNYQTHAYSKILHAAVDATSTTTATIIRFLDFFALLS